MCVILQLYGLNKEKLKGLKQYKDYCIESELSSGDKALSFLYPANLAKDIVEEGYIRNKTDEFVIKEISKQGQWKSIKAKLNVEDLEGKVFESFETVNENITDCINLALAGTGWIVGTCNVTKRRTVRKTNSSSWDIIQEAKKVYRCELEFDTLNKKINIYEKRGSDKGVYFLDSLNLKDLSIQGDSYDFYTRIIAKGKDDLKVTLENFQYSSKVKTYIWKDERYTNIESLTEDAKAKLDELSKPYRAYSATIIDLANISKENYKDILSYGLGDVITIVSKESGLKEKQRIVKMVEYPDEPTRNTCEIANTTLSFEDVQKEFQDTTDTVNNITTDNGTIDGSTIDGISTEQIYDFEASVVKITNLTVINAQIEELYAGKANIGELNAVIANVAELNATKANITDLTAINASIANLQADKANITDLTAINIKFNVASGGTLDLQTLISKFVSGENGQFLNLTTDNVTISNAVIKDIIAKNISVEDLKAGRISTTKFTIASDDGGIQIVGATQQFKDKNNKVRIQMGQDTQGNFNFILRGEDGTTTLIDHTGIKEKAIADDLIKSNMVAEDAIGEKQINYSSLITGLNKDTNTSLIKASKVAIDLTGQSLEVSFNNLKSNIDGMQVGCRNLYKGTADFSPQYWRADSISDYELDSRYKKVFVKAYNISPYGLSTQTKIQGFDFSDTTKTWTISAMVKAETEGQMLGLTLDGVRLYYDPKPLTTSWAKYTWTFKGLRSLQTFRFKGNDEQETNGCYIALIKVEEGNKATDWTPALEDIDQKIESNTTAISIAQGKIEGLISENSIIKGDVTTISDKYTSIKATVDGINTTVASHTSSIGNISTDLATANALADSKAKIFTSTPTTPYKVGDLWVQGTSGEIMKCKTSRVSGSYVSSDWEKASKYTDDTKANTVEGNLNTLSGKVTIVENNYTSLSQDLSGFKTTVANNYSTKTELSGVDGKVTSLNSRVSTAESSITQLNNKIALKVEATDITEAINNISIGGRNLALGTSKEFKTVTANTGTNLMSARTLDDLGLVVGDIVSGRVYIDNSDSTLATKIRLYGAVNGTNKTIIYGNTIAIGSKGYSYFTTTIPEGCTNLRVIIYSSSANITKVKEFKLEKGTKPTDWAPAPEDVDSSIANVQTQVTTTSNKVAEIETSLSSINLKVQSTEQTVSSHTTQLGQVDNKISTAKTEAINSASNDATSKVNSALTSAKSYTDGQITTVNQTITDKVAEIKLTTDSITQRVSSTESTLISHTTELGKVDNKINTAIDNVQIGGRNLLIRSRETKNTYISTSGSVTSANGFATSDYIEVSEGEILAFSKQNSTTDGYFRWAWYDSNKTYIDRKPNNQNSFLWEVPQNAKFIRISYPMDAYPKVEKGNKTTDWTPAPEDVENDATNKANNALTSAKDYTNGQITTVNKTITDKVAEIKLTTDSITQKVSSTETNLTSTTSIANSALASANSANSKIDGFEVGGVNLLVQKSITKGKFLTNTGATSNNSLWFYSDYINVEGFKNVRISGFTNLGSAPSSCFYDENKTFISGINNGNANNISGVTNKCELMEVPRNAVYMRCSGEVKDLPTLKIEKGTKATNYSPAPEDIDLAITNVDTKITTTNNKVATIETNLSSITSRVSSTESSITTINGNVASLQSRMTTAEQKITDSAIISTVKSTINTAKTEAINSSNSTTDTKLKNYSTTTQMQSIISQTVQDWTANFTSSSYGNLVPNGRFINRDFNSGDYNWFWYQSGASIQISPQMSDGTGIGFKNSNLTTANKTVSLFSGEFRLEPNTKYTLTFNFAKNSNVGDVRMVVEQKNYNKEVCGAYYTPYLTDEGEKSYTFTTDANARYGKIILNHSGIISGVSGNGYAWLNNVRLNQGSNKMPWTPCITEIASTTVRLSLDGIEINSSNAKTKNLINADGMMIKDSTTNDSILSVDSDGVHAKGGKFIVEDSKNGNTILWGRDITINGQRALVGMGSTADGTSIANRLYINYNGDFKNGVEIAGNLLNNSLWVLSDAGHLKEEQGYFKFSNGMIIQWGSVKGIPITSGTSVDTLINYKISFPLDCVAVVGSISTVDKSNAQAVLFNSIFRKPDTNSKAQFRFRAQRMSGDAWGSLMDISYIAIGY